MFLSHVASIDFPLNSKWDAFSHHIADGYSRVEWDKLHNHLKVIPWEISLNFYMYISLIVSIRSSLSHHGFQQVVLLPYFIEITFLFVPT